MSTAKHPKHANAYATLADHAILKQFHRWASNSFDDLPPQTRYNEKYRLRKATMTEHVDHRQRRWGLLVLIACAIVGLGLLLPAIRFERDRPGRRTQCANNLKQCGLATIGFETTKKKFPGIQSLFSSNQDRGKLGTWVVSILPYVEEQILADLWDTPANQDQWEAEWLQATTDNTSQFYPSLPSLRCPNDGESYDELGITNYIANAGFYLRTDDRALGLPNYKDVSDDSQRSTIAQRSANGIFVNLLPANVYDPRTKQSQAVFGVAKPIKPSEIRDGTSSTIAFTESTIGRPWKSVSITEDSVRYQLGAVWLYAGDKASADRPEPQALTPAMRIAEKPDTKLLSPLNSRPSSNHAEVFNVAMLDGSVRCVSVNIDYHVYQSLMAPRNRDSDMPDLDYVLKATDY
jgi:Protein of unknown function (DUF1559)